MGLINKWSFTIKNERQIVQNLYRVLISFGFVEWLQWPSSSMLCYLNQMVSQNLFSAFRLFCWKVNAHNWHHEIEAVVVDSTQYNNQKDKHSVKHEKVKHTYVFQNCYFESLLLNQVLFILYNRYRFIYPLTTFYYMKIKCISFLISFKLLKILH